MSNDEKILKSAQCKIDKMFYRFKHRFLAGWLRLLYSLRIKWKIYYASHLAQIVIWFFQIVFCCSYIVPYHHMLISPYLQVNQFHVFHIWNFAIYGRHYSGNIKVRMRRKIFQLQRNFIEFFFYRERCYFTRFPFLGYGILAGHPRCWRQKTDVPALNSKQNNKQNFYNAHGAEYIANVCWWLWSTGHLLLAM